MTDGRMAGDFRAVRTRTAMLVALAGACVWLAPWTGYLARTLPAQHDTDQWRLAWVGFDVALMCCFAVATALAWRRHRNALPILVATATLMCCDAWFDVVLDWDGPDRWTSLAMAVLAELPTAGWLLLRARWLLVGPVAQRPVDMREIDEVMGDARAREVMRVLGREWPLSEAELTVRAGMPPYELAACLARLARYGHAARDRAGRWRPLPLNLRMPDLSEVDPAHRDRYRAFMRAKHDRELRLFARAARQWDGFGAWAQGSRGSAYLTSDELAHFYCEYLELLLRYSLLHDRPGRGVREVAVRFYAFPHSVVEAEDSAGTVPSGQSR